MSIHETAPIDPKASQVPRVLLAPNPSPLTGPGTNTFMLGHKKIAVIDPGPDLPSHIEAISQAAGDGCITHIFVTHAHLDHSAGAARLSQMTGAPILGFGPASAGRSAVMSRLLDQGFLGGGEGVDASFDPDICLREGDSISTAEWQLSALHTPGHFCNHLSFVAGDHVFCGDLVLGWSSTLISPPDGDLADFMRSLAKLERLGARRLYPAHGAPVDHVAQRLHDLAQHRRDRSMQILTALDESPANAETLARRIYDVGPELIHAASRNVLAHLIALADLGALRHEGKLQENSVFYAR